MSARLSGCGVLIVRPAGLGDRMARLLEREGARPLLFPTIDVLPAARPARLAAVIARLQTFDWAIFISPTAAREGLRSVRSCRDWPPAPQGPRLAAVGRGTASALEELGFEQVLAPAAPGDSEALAALPELHGIEGQNVVIFRGEGGREHLARVLAERGARVEYAECYRRSRPATDPAPVIDRLRSGEIHAVCAASGEALTNLRELLAEEGMALARDTPVFVPHPRVAGVAREAGFSHTIVVTGGDEATVEGLAAFFAKV
jgi:uroporphyrinogen-III synthase